jgi:hypothetical protein
MALQSCVTRSSVRGHCLTVLARSLAMCAPPTVAWLSITVAHRQKEESIYASCMMVAGMCIYAFYAAATPIDREWSIHSLLLEAACYVPFHYACYKQLLTSVRRLCNY